MEYRQLGRAGTRVSQLCLGTMNFGKVTDEGTAIRIVDEALDAGINFIDAADVYQRGVSEEYVGKALSQNGRRHEVVLATKAVGSMGPGPNQRGAGRVHLVRAVEDSLRRLQTDRIDLFYLHVVDVDTPMVEVFDQLDVLVRQGKILYVGTSKWPVPLIMEAISVSEKWGYPRIVVEQPPYNLCDRSIELELIWTCRRFGIGLVTFAPLANGVLSGVYRRDRPIVDGHRFSGADIDAHGRLTRKALDRVEELVPVAESCGITLSQLCHAWLLQRVGVTTPIMGPRSPEHLHEALASVDVELEQETLDRIDRLAPPGSAVSDFYHVNTYARMLRAVNDPSNPTGY